MREVVVVEALRTPIGKLGGTLGGMSAEALTSIVIDGVVKATGIHKSEIDEVICGQAKQSTDAPNIARVASLMSDLPIDMPAYTVHRQCASGMQAILNAMMQIQTGLSDIVIAAGVESMSTAPFYIRNARYGLGSGNTMLLDPNVESQPRSQPADKFGVFNMIETAENVAKQYDISRAAQDLFALQSQQKATAAIDSGRFLDEILPIVIRQKKGEPLLFDTDEFPRRDTSLEKLSKLRTIMPEGTVTAGNASGRNDGAVALVMMSAERAKTLGLKPLVKILAGAAAGVDPRMMGIGPVASTEKLMAMLKPRGIGLKHMSLVEINEAFAAQTIACIDRLGFDEKIVNVNGGAIALGHPLGCSGGRIVTTLIHEMKRRDSAFGLATICIAGGMGMSVAFENIY
ncbi:thiolase family protein [Fusibacter paucivorans]|uniref:acetyl-CoA C-acetyltransferase n=1 Tax=Fusibacter paucivorans TaxID=76009 RepID=A0ABS5PMJ8_9FIRM|nr:thiolase family protein [Fusibacter paucivorans]MBS7525272.1 thiolase family protein [Fusibacter paucivorans]